MSAAGAHHENRAMNHGFTRGSRLLASAIAMAVALVSSATCLATVMQMPEQARHACCQGMEHDCGSAGSVTVAADCCAVQSGDVAPLTTTTEAIRGSATSLITASLFEPVPLQGSPGAALDPGIPKPSAAPTYLLVSVFRL